MPSGNSGRPGADANATSAGDAIPALSVRQPWAELIVAGRKTIEVRSWSTDYRGLLWIHAGLKEDRTFEESFGLSNLFHGGFIGCVKLASVMRFDPERWERWRGRHLAQGPMPPRAFAWVLSEPMRLNRAISARGELGLFTPGAEALQALEQGLSEARGNGAV